MNTIMDAPRGDRMGMNNLNSAEKGCPYINEDHRECYSFKLNAHNMVQAIHYCLDNYAACETYMEKSKSDGPECN